MEFNLTNIIDFKRMIKDFAIVSSNARVTVFFLCRLTVTKKTSIQISEIGKK